MLTGRQSFHLLFSFQVPSIHKMVDMFRTFLPLDVAVVVYLGYALAQSLVAVPYLLEG